MLSSATAFVQCNLRVPSVDSFVQNSHSSLLLLERRASGSSSCCILAFRVVP